MWDLQKFPNHDDDNEEENALLDFDHLDFSDNNMVPFDNPMDLFLLGSLV